MKLIVIIFSFVIVNVNVIGQIEDKPSFRIVAPQFICKTKGEQELPSPTQITIRMQTRGGQKLVYLVQIYFKLLGDFRSQQHSLSIWQSVRRLEKKLRDESDIISIKNQISIQNNELTPGVFYVFNILGKNEHNVNSDSQNFSIIYRGGNFASETLQEGTSTTDEVSLLLMGAEVTRGDIPFIAEAKAIFCSPTNDFYIKWEMTNLRNLNDKNYLLTRGNTIRIPSGILRGGDTHELSAEIIGNNDVPLTKAAMRLNVLKKGFNAIISPKSVIAGINKETEIHVFTKDSDNTGEDFLFQWTCKNIKLNSPCEYFNGENNDTQLLSFISQGEYEIKVIVSLNGTSKTLTSIINVNPSVIASASIKNIPTTPIPSNERSEIFATISDLVPNCFTEWTVVKEDGFAYFNSSEIIGGLGHETIRDVDETFLSELVDYGNDTVTKDLPLIIPNRSLNDTWKGLEPDAQYKFRLIIICPEPVDNRNPQPKKNITSYSDVIITTNGPPIPLPLEVTPLGGVALRTIFKFSTGIAKDISTDYPLKYSFKYIVDDHLINAGEFYEIMVTTIDLPYSKNPIQTLLQVCDSRGACSSDIIGPNITMELITNITNDELQYKFDFIKKNMANMEFETSFNTALACILTFQHLDNKMYLTKTLETIKFSIRNSIKNMKTTNKMKILKVDLIKFVKLSKQSLDSLKVNDVELYKELLQLMELTLIGNTKFVEFNLKRKKRSEQNNEHGINVVDKNFVDMLLDLTEQSIQPNEIMKQSKIELDFAIKVHQYMTLLCQNMNVNSDYFNKTIVSFELSRIERQNIFLTNYSVPSIQYENSAYIYINRNLLLPPKKYCIGKARYPSDYLTSVEEDNNPIYEIILLENGEIIQLKNEDETVLVNIPFINNDENKKNMEFSCALWEQRNWSIDKCKLISMAEDRIQCKCSNIGYFKIMPTNKTRELMKTTAITTTEVTTEKSTVTMTTTTIATTPKLENEISTVATIIVASTELPITSTTTQTTTTKQTTMTPMTETTVASTMAAVTPLPMLPTTVPVTVAPTLVSLPLSSVAAVITTVTPVKLLDQKENILLDKPKSVVIPEKINENYVATSTAGIVIGYSTVALLILAAICGIIFGIFYRRRKQRHHIVQETEILSSQFRRRSPGIKYARFHDEQNMFGDFQDYNTVS